MGSPVVTQTVAGVQYLVFSFDFKYRTPSFLYILWKDEVWEWPALPLTDILKESSLPITVTREVSSVSPDGFLVSVWKSDSFTHRGVWHSHCIASGPAECSVSLCCVWWGGGRCRWAVGRGDRRGWQRDILLFYHLWLEIPPLLSSWLHRHSPCHLPSPYLPHHPPLCSRHSCFFSVILPPFLCSAFVPLNHPISCPRFRTFPNLVFCFSHRVKLEAGTEPHLWRPQPSLEITATLCASICVSIFSFTKFCCHFFLPVSPLSVNSLTKNQSFFEWVFFNS